GVPVAHGPDSRAHARIAPRPHGADPGRGRPRAGRDRPQPPRGGGRRPLIAAGALAAAAAVTALVLAVRRRSPVGTRLARISPDERRASSRLHALVARDARDLVQSGLGWSELDLIRAKVVGALAMDVLASAVAIVTPVGPIVVVAAAYAGFVAPSLRIARLAASPRDAAVCAPRSVPAASTPPAGSRGGSCSCSSSVTCRRSCSSSSYRSFSACSTAYSDD